MIKLYDCKQELEKTTSFISRAALIVYNIVDLYAFFSLDVLTYCVMLQAFICYCSSSDVYDVRACARVCVLFIGIVQRS